MEEINNLLKEICICGHSRFMHGYDLKEVDSHGLFKPFRNTKDKKCSVSSCICKKFVLDKTKN